MQVFEWVIQWLVNLGVVIIAIAIYLNVNKVWNRKHERVVAESISTGGRSIAIAVALPFILNFVLKRDYRTLASYLILFFNDAVFFLVSIGFWVRDGKRIRIWQKFLRALRQERNEVGNLIKALTKPNEEQQLFAILHRLAWLDERLDDRERQYIETFAEAWDINIGDLLHQPPEQGVKKFQYLRQAVKDYLELEPPKEQVEWFSDLVRTLLAADEEITSDEELIGGEIAAMVDRYVNRGTAHVFGIIVHPKDEDQKNLVWAALPESKLDYLLGAHAFLAGTFHTKRYAEIISESYRQQGWFTVVHDYTVPT